MPSAGEFVEIGGSIGVVLLLLTLGLEFPVDELAASTARHLPSAVVDLELNATPGAVAGWLLGLNPIGNPGPRRSDLGLIFRDRRPDARRPGPPG